MHLLRNPSILLLVVTALLTTSAEARAQTARDKAAIEASAEVWTDQETGLMWTKKDNGSDVTWQATLTGACRRSTCCSAFTIPTSMSLAIAAVEKMPLCT